MKLLLLRFIANVLLAAALMHCCIRANAQTPNDASDRESIVAGAIHPHLSGDGRTIVFSYQGAIWRMSTDGGTMTRLTSQPGFDMRPVLSPDGRWVAFLRTEGAWNGVVKLIRASDGKERRLSREVRADGRLQFSPDGSRLLGNFRRDGDGRSVRWLDLKRGLLGPVLLKNERLKPITLFTEGGQIAFVTDRDVSGLEQEGNNGPENTVWSMGAEGGTPEKLFSFPAKIFHLEPSADGAALFSVTDLGGPHYALWRIPLNRPAAAEKITFGQGDEDHVSASRDGRLLLFTDNRRGPTSLRLRDLSSGIDREVTVSRRDFREATGALRLDIVDEKTNRPTTARIVVQRIDGKFHAPQNSLYGIWKGRMHFYATDTVELELPVGSYRVAADRGPEYRVVHLEVEIKAGSATNIGLRLKRWTDQPSLGWYSGESHIHANYGEGYWYNSPRTMLTLCAGEDLHVANMMVANSDSDGVFDREYFRGRPDALSTDETLLYWNEEFRSTIWGHMTLLNLKRLVEPIFTGFENTTHPHDYPTNADIAGHTHEQDGHVNYTHPARNVSDPYLSAYAAKELPVDVALGTVDSIDVMGSDHEANMALWYRLLNCGFAIPASAGTDCFSNRIPARRPGEVRVYVNVDEDYSYKNWIKNLQRGRTFVTNGPMLKFAAGQKKIGETIALSEPDEVSIKGTVTSQFPLDRAELVFNGRVVATKEADADSPNSIEFEMDFPVTQGGWLALRAYGQWHRDAVPKQFAHTSPIYVTVEGHPNDSREDAAYFVHWIDRLWKDVQERARISPDHHDHVKAQIDQARAIYQKLAVSD